MPLAVFVSLVLGNVYSAPARYFYFPDVKRLSISATVGWLTGFLILLGFLHRNASISLVVIGLGLLVPLITMPRIAARMIWEQHSGGRRSQDPRILIYGAGRGGNALANWIKFQRLEVRLIGFIEDNLALVGKDAFGYRVWGQERDLPTIRALHDVNELWVTFVPDGIQQQRLETVCSKEGSCTSSGGAEGGV